MEKYFLNFPSRRILMVEFTKATFSSFITFVWNSSVLFRIRFLRFSKRQNVALSKMKVYTEDNLNAAQIMAFLNHSITEK